jgi:YbbR domain-containing protein
MNTEIIIHASDYPVEKESIHTYVDLNLAGKMDTYIQKIAKDESDPVRVELTVKKENDGQAAGKLIISTSKVSYRSERENFNNLSDLVNHLFTHIKDQMAK